MPSSLAWGWGNAGKDPKLRDGSAGNQSTDDQRDSDGNGEGRQKVEDKNPYAAGSFDFWYYDKAGMYENRLEAYRAWQSEPGYHPGERFWDRTAV
ncbi:MAG TPA: hypothetical protein VL098_04345 [Flavipsychrobacter sp.]|nr:hypothetical protein [Flavipsychrobacter sp.]